MKMSEEQRENEEVRREKIRAGAGKVVPGSGRRGTPRRMAQMVSVRLDGELISKLRVVARERNATLSDLLREGAEQVVANTEVAAKPRISYTISGANDEIPTVVDEGAYAVN